MARRRFADFQHGRQTATGKRDADRRDRSHGRNRPSPPGERHPRSAHLAHLADRLRHTTERERQRTEQERLAKEQERLAKEQVQQRVERLEEMLRSQGIDPDQLLDV